MAKQKEEKLMSDEEKVDPLPAEAPTPDGEPTPA